MVNYWSLLRPLFQKNPKDMTVDDSFVEQVAYMRKMQREWFLYHRPEALKAAKVAETKVDRMLENMKTPTLF